MEEGERGLKRAEGGTEGHAQYINTSLQVSYGYRDTGPICCSSE